MSGKAPGSGDEVYKTIFENLPFVAFTVDGRGRILEANKYTEGLFRIRIEEAKGKLFSHIVFLGKKDMIKALVDISKIARGQVTSKKVYDVRLKDGRRMLLELVGIPIKKGGKVEKLLIVGTDITETKRSEEEVKKKSDDLEKFNKMAIGREMRMVELKKRVKELEEKLGKKG